MAVQPVEIDTKRAVSKLDNGLTVALEPLPHLRSLAAGVWVRTGSADETARIAGVSHFLEHLVFKGTDTRSAREIMDAIESRGGHMNAFTSREYTCYYIRCLDEHLDIALDILADIVQRPTYHDFEKERTVILEEIAASSDVPEECVHDFLSTQMWPDHALGRPVAGSAESVSATSLDDVRAYKESRYQPGNMLVSIAGNIQEKRTRDLVEKYFGGMTTRPSDDTKNSPRFSPGIKAIDREIAQNHLAMAFQTPSISDGRRHVCDLLSNVLGGGSTSRLFERIREDEGLAYSVYAFHSAYEHTGMMGVYAAVAPENIDQALDIVSEELRRIKDEPVGEKELQSNKEQLKGGLLLALESTFNRMARLARSLMYFGEIKTIDRIIQEVDNVTAEQIQELARVTFTNENSALTVLGPKNGTAIQFNLNQ